MSERLSDKRGYVKTLSVIAFLVTIASLSGCLSGDSSGGVTSGAGSQGADNNPANSPPLISGSPDSAVLTGNVYSFAPSASDPDGDSLTFSVSNKPTWASFDSTTGRLSGQALLGDVGSYGGIRISVSDGSASSSLPDFSITVTQTALGSISLSWRPPTRNDDGSTLTDLAGYKLYYGLSTGNYDNMIRIDNPSVSTYLIENLVPDTYYVAATAFNAAGIESVYSTEAVKTIPSN